MKTTIKTHYRWLGAHGADYHTCGYAIITTPGFTADGATVELFAQMSNNPADIRAVDPQLPMLVVDFLDPAGQREHEALTSAGYRVKDTTYYLPWPAGAADAARAYWAAHRSS